MSANIAIRALSKIKRLIEFKRSIAYFISENRVYWESTKSSSEKIIYIELSERNPIELEYVFRISKTLQELTRAKIHVYFSGLLLQRSWIFRVIASYNVNKIVGVTNSLLKSPALIFNSFRISLVLSKDIGRSIKKLETTTHLEILIGDLVYDEYLRLHAPGFDIDFNLRLYFLLFKAVLYVEFFQREIQSKKPLFLVLGDRCYIKHGVFLRCGVQHEIPVYVPWRTIRIVDKNNLYDHPTHPGKAFEEIESEIAEHDVEFEINEYFKRRFSGEINEIDVYTAFKNKVNVDRNEVIKLCGLDSSKKIALIMPHAFKDFPHISKGVYRDYYIWLRNLLELTRNVTTVNWVIKPHPTSYLFGENGEVERLLAELNIENVRILPSHISTASVKEFADYILTVNGTAGLEFSTFGIPTINAGRSPYSDFGFNIEAHSEEDYRKIIYNISAIPRLSSEQIRRASVIFYYIMVRENVFPSYVLENIGTSIQDYNLGFRNVIQYNLRNPKTENTIYASTKAIFRARNSVFSLL